MPSAPADPPSTASAPAIGVTIEPAWTMWREAIERRHANDARAQLGLATDRPVVFSGHQPIVFHNGILAKLIALDEACSRTGAAPVWIVADQDHADPGPVRVPTGSGQGLHARVLDLLPPGSVPPGVPTASLPARRVEPAQDSRLMDLTERLNRFADAPSLGEQFARATIDLACERLGIEQRPALLFASRLSRSDALQSVVERMAGSPLECVRAYNSAVRAHADADVRELTIEEGRVELPLWGLRPMQPRVAIDTGNIDQFSREELAPRGLLMSLLVRAHLGELFIHGTGGWAYDRITQDWAKAWLGIELSPMALTTATQRLDLGFAPEQIIDPARAIWQAHHARHNPAAVGDDQAQINKDELVERIEAMRAEGEDPARQFRNMHSLLDEYRVHHAQQLAAFDERVRVARAMHRQLELAADRTWPFILFDDQALNQLKDAVAAALG